MSFKKTVARGAFFVALFVVWILIAVPAVQRDIQVSGDTVAWLKLVETTSNTTQIELFLQNSLDGIHKWNIETGYYDPIVHNTGTDMSVLVNTINDFIVQAHNISLIPENSTERATAMLVFRAQFHSFIDHYLSNICDASATYWWSTTTLHLWQIWAWLGWLFNLIILFVVNHAATSVYESFAERRYDAKCEAESKARAAKYEALKKTGKDGTEEE